jgi:hypothetical protein
MVVRIISNGTRNVFIQLLCLVVIVFGAANYVLNNLSSYDNLARPSAKTASGVKHHKHVSPDWPFDVNYTKDVGYDPDIVDHIRTDVFMVPEPEKIGTVDRSTEDPSENFFASKWVIPRLFEGIVVSFPHIVFPATVNFYSTS